MKYGWEEKNLGEIIKLEYGKPLPNDKRIPDGKYPVYGANGEKDRTNEFYYDKPSIIVGRKGSAGEVNLTEKRFWPLDVTYFVTFDEKKYNLKFLFNLLLTLNLPELARGVKPGINRNEVYDITVKTPSLSEQERIVNFIERVFEKATKAKENAEKNLQNARELFESYLQNIFANPGDDWEGKTIGEIADVEYGFTDKAKDFGDYRYIRITDIDKNGVLAKDGRVYIESSKEAKKFILKDGDLLMARTGATYAKVLLYENHEKSVFASYLIRIIFKRDIINKLYWYFSKSRIYWEQANRLSSGSAQPQFNGSALKELIFYFPKSVEEQERIINKLDSLSLEVRKLEARYKKKLDDLEELKKSVLHKAFNGELAGACS